MTASTEVRTSDEQSPGHPTFDIGRWLIVVVIAVMAFVVFGFARDRIVAPFDDLVTEQMCLRYGEEIERTLVDFERSNNFALRDRTDGFCSYGPGLDGEPTITLPVADTNPGALYTWAKAIGIIVQLGVVSIFIRLVTDPAMETYKFLRQRFGSSTNR